MIPQKSCIAKQDLNYFRLKDSVIKYELIKYDNKISPVNSRKLDKNRNIRRQKFNLKNRSFMEMKVIYIFINERKQCQANTDFIQKNKGKC